MNEKKNGIGYRFNIFLFGIISFFLHLFRARILILICLKFHFFPHYSLISEFRIDCVREIIIFRYFGSVSFDSMIFKWPMWQLVSACKQIWCYKCADRWCSKWFIELIMWACAYVYRVEMDRTGPKSLANSFLMTLSIWKNNPFQSVVVVDCAAAADNSDNIL